MKYKIQSILFVLVAFMLGCNEYMIVGVLKDIHSDMGTPLANKVSWLPYLHWFIHSVPHSFHY